MFCRKNLEQTILVAVLWFLSYCLDLYAYKYHHIPQKILTKTTKLFILRVQDFKLIYLSYFLSMLTFYADCFYGRVTCNTNNTFKNKYVSYIHCELWILRLKCLMINHSFTTSKHSLVWILMESTRPLLMEYPLYFVVLRSNRVEIEAEIEPLKWYIRCMLILVLYRYSCTRYELLYDVRMTW